MYTAIVILIVLQDILTIFIIRGMRAENIRISLENSALKKFIENIGGENEKDK